MSIFTHTVGKKGGEEFNSPVPVVCLQNHSALIEPTNEKAQSLFSYPS